MQETKDERFKRLYKNYNKMVNGVLFGMHYNDDERKDLSQDVWVFIWKYLDQVDYQWEPAYVRNTVNQIVYTHIHKQQNTKNKAQSTAIKITGKQNDGDEYNLSDTIKGDYYADTNLDNIVRDEIILEFMLRLKPIHREIVYDYYLRKDRLTLEQLADKHNTSKQNIHQKLLLAQEKLKYMFKKNKLKLENLI